MANILYGDSSEEKTIFNDSKVSELIIRNIYAATDSQIAGYKKESNGSLFYYVNKFNARNAGYISADFRQPASVKPSADFFDVCFHTVDEFSAETRDASLKLSRKDDFNEFNAEHYSYIADRILYNIEQGNTVYIRLKDTYDNLESISKELSFAAKLMPAFAEYLQKEIAFVCNAKDNKQISANVVFISEEASVSGGTLIDCRVPDFKAASKPYSVYLSRVITGAEPKDEELEQFFKKYVSERFLRTGNKVKNPFSDLFVIYKFDGNPKKTQDFIENCKLFLERYGNCLKDPDEFKEFIKTKLDEETWKKNFEDEKEVVVEVPQDNNVVSTESPQANNEATNININFAEATYKAPDQNTISDSLAQNEHLGNADYNSDIVSVPEKIESAVKSVDSTECEIASNNHIESNSDIEKSSSELLNDVVNQNSYYASRNDEKKPERMQYSVSLNRDKYFSVILNQWEYFYKYITSIRSSFQIKDNFFSVNPISPLQLAKTSVEDPSLIYKIPEKVCENINEVNNVQSIVMNLYTYLASKVLTRFSLIVSNQAYDVDDVYIIAVYTYVCKMLFECYSINTRDSNYKLERILNFELTNVRTDISLNCPELMFELVLDYLTILKSLSGNMYNNYGSEKKRVIDAVINYCTIDLTKKQCITRFLEVINRIDQTNELKYSVKADLLEMLKDKYGGFYNFDTEN